MAPQYELYNSMLRRAGFIDSRKSRFEPGIMVSSYKPGKKLREGGVAGTVEIWTAIDDTKNTYDQVEVRYDLTVEGALFQGSIAGPGTVEVKVSTVLKLLSTATTHSS
jgi:hypothetical protein